MHLFQTNFRIRTWLAAAAAALALAACGGGGGDDGANVSGAFEQNNPPASGSGATGSGSNDSGSTGSGQAPIQELSNTFGAALAGAQEVPPTPSTGSASGTAVVNPVTREMLATVTTAGIPGTAAHIHEAPGGVNGPIIFPLIETAPGSGTWTARATLTEAQFNTLKAGGFYFNVHSAAFPNGEIRGQITTQAASGTAGGAGFIPSPTSATTFSSALRGEQEVPPTPSTGLGAGTLLTLPATREVIASIVTAGIPGNAAHIHQAPRGVNGPIIVPLAETTPGSGIWTGRATLTEERFNALQSGNLYFNVHSATFPNGEIRGQIHAQGRASDSSATPPGSGSSGFGTTGDSAAGSDGNTGSIPFVVPAPFINDNPSLGDDPLFSSDEDF
jgi:hypothetical protein